MQNPNLSPDEHSQAVFLIGPWLIGSILEIFLQGILCCQFLHYWIWYRDDNYRMWFCVGGLMILTTLKSAQAFAIMWIQGIVYINDLEGAILLAYTAWYETYGPLFVAIIGVYVQAFFLHRLWTISQRWWAVVPTATIFVFGFIAVIYATVKIPTQNIQLLNNWFVIHMSAVFAGNFLITTLMTYFLVRLKPEILSRLSEAAIPLTFQTAALPTLCALINLILGKVYSLDKNLISCIFNMMLPKLYGVSLMWTLNARKPTFATRDDTPVEFSLGGHTDSTRTTSGRRTNDGIELRFAKPVQSGAQESTIQRIELDGQWRTQHGSVNSHSVEEIIVEEEEELAAVKKSGEIV